MEYLAYWGYATSVVTLVTALLSPVLGALADTKGFKAHLHALPGVGVVGCCVMGFARQWLPFLMIFVLAKIGYTHGSLVYYDSMLSDVTTPGGWTICPPAGTPGATLEAASPLWSAWRWHWAQGPLV